MRGRTGCGAVSRVGVPLRHSTLTAQGAGLGLQWRAVEAGAGATERPRSPSVSAPHRESPARPTGPGLLTYLIVPKVPKGARRAALLWVQSKAVGIPTLRRMNPYMCVGGRTRERKIAARKKPSKLSSKKCCGNRAVACALCVRPRSDLRVLRPRGLANTAFGNRPSCL